MRKTLLLITTILILQVFNSCKTQYSVAELNAHCTKEQIADLEEITVFCKSEMCLHMDSDFKACYERIPLEYLEATGSGFWTNIGFDEKKKLYEQISKSTFNEIWMFCESTYYPNETKTMSICANATGKYQKFLADLGKTNPRIAKYAEEIQASGDFNGLHVQYWEVLKDKKSFDLNDPNIQLVLAIHYLSMNDDTMRNDNLIERGKVKFN